MVDGQALASQNRSSAKKLLQKTEVLCKFASKQEVLTNCCKIETLQMAGKNRGFAKIATKKTETLQPKKNCSKREVLEICFKCVTLPQLCNTIFCLKPLEFYHLLCCPPPPIFSLN
jgi:hypothetical protein